jgi:hypothetical protein
MEDLNLYLKDVLAERPHTRVPSADCGSYSEDIVKMVMEHTDKFYIRAERYAGLYEKVKRQTGWKLREFIVQLVVQFIVQSIILFVILFWHIILYCIKQTAQHELNKRRAFTSTVAFLDNVIIGLLMLSSYGFYG